MMAGGANEALKRDAFLSEQLGYDAWHLDGGCVWRDGSKVTAALRDVAGPAFVDVKLPADAGVEELMLLRSHGFDVVDTAVTLERPRDDEEESPSLCALRTARIADEPAVVRLARMALTTSRFHRDLLVGEARAERVKEAWVRNYFVGTRGEVMIVAPASDQSQADGFLLAVAGRDGAMVTDLVAVAPHARRRGLCRAMTIAAQAHFPDAARLRVGTQGSNHGSIAAYRRIGFEIVRTELVLHAHLSAERTSGARVA